MESKNKIIEYAVLIDGDDATIITSDGSIVTVHHNGFHLLTTYYQDEVNKFTFDSAMWDKLAEGKQYLNDWEDKQAIDEEIILDALEWMNVFSGNFKKVPFEKLVKEFNNL